MELGDGWQPNRCVLEKIRIRVNSCPFLINSLLIMIILDSSSCLSYSIVYNITNEKCFVAYNLIFPGTRESRLIQMFVYVMLSERTWKLIANQFGVLGMSFPGSDYRPLIRYITALKFREFVTTRLNFDYQITLVAKFVFGIKDMFSEKKIQWV